MRSYYIIFLLLMMCQVSKAQGIYKTATDFSLGVKYITPTKNQLFKVFPHRYLNTKSIKVRVGDSTLTLMKSEIYGYQDTDGKVYRFQNNERYLILNPTEKLLLYSKSVLGGPKKNIPTTIYFFSSDPTSNIVNLTLFNLKNNFRNNPQLIQLIDLYFKDESDVLNFDSFNNMYKINHLIALSKH